MQNKTIIFLALLCASFSGSAYSCYEEQKTTHSSSAHEKDVIAFVANAHGEAEIYGVGGLDESIISTVNDKVKEQDYITVLKHIWSEHNCTRKKAWLSEKVKEGHPILMLELAKVLVREKSIEEGLNWYYMGLIRSCQDAFCCDDRSLHSDKIPGTLAQAYSCFFDSHTKGIEDPLAIEKALENLLKDQQYPSPQWVGYHGTKALSDNIKLLPENNFPQKRQEVLGSYCNLMTKKTGAYMSKTALNLVKAHCLTIAATLIAISAGSFLVLHIVRNCLK